MQQLICEYMEAIGMKRDQFARERCRRSLSWLNKILSGEVQFSWTAAMVLEFATDRELRAKELLEMAEKPVEKPKHGTRK